MWPSRRSPGSGSCSRPCRSAHRRARPLAPRTSSRAPARPRRQHGPEPLKLTPAAPIQRPMRRRLVPPTLLAIAIAVAYGWVELTGYLWTDYELANELPFRALVHGHLATFFHSAPIEGPSLLLRAPFALGAWLWGGSDMAIYRMTSVPGLLA